MSIQPPQLERVSEATAGPVLGTGPQRLWLRLSLFAVVGVLAAIVALTYVGLALLEYDPTNRRIAEQPGVAIGALMSSDKSPHILFPRSDGETYRRVSLTAFGGGDERL
jgi:hypothetical protein